MEDVSLHHAHGVRRPTEDSSIAGMAAGTPGSMVFVGLCLFIIRKDRITVAMIRETHATIGDSCLQHVPFIYRNARDFGELSIPSKVRSFPDVTGGEWIGFGLENESSFGNPAAGRPDYSGLGGTASSPFKVPELSRIGFRTTGRQLKTTWPQYAGAVIDLFGGALTTNAPQIGGFKIEWVFKPAAATTPDYERMYIAEQVVWSSGNAGPTLIAANLPFSSLHDAAKQSKQLVHFEMFYDLFKDPDPVVLPSDPSGLREVFPIFCPPAMYIEG
jgi:hypothetical protein